MMKSVVTIAAVTLVLLVQLPATAADTATGTQWHQKPFRLKAGEKLLDTHPADLGGHAAPFLADIDGDGRRDLTVGSIHGYFHFFRNVGTDAAPLFGEKSTYLMAGLSGDEPARSPNHCCVASGPQLQDIDGDGILDLTSGSYAPGFVYWFKGRGDGKFHLRQILTDTAGWPAMPMPEQNPYAEVYGESGANTLGNYMANIAWTDWDDNGHPDLIIGNIEGRLFPRLNAKGVVETGNSVAPPPIASEPQFLPKFMQGQLQKPTEILIGGERAIPEKHAAPAVADWDGDGLWDILVGSESGRVYWLRNTGKKGAPAFESRQEILGRGKHRHVIESGEAPGQGIRTQIQAVDYNLDGKLDLLVGEWGEVSTIPEGLADAERRARKENPAKYWSGNKSRKTMGHVWVYLRK
jgi:hypothetical protein